jgi:hypothetical protein
MGVLKVYRLQQKRREIRHLAAAAKLWREEGWLELTVLCSDEGAGWLGERNIFEEKEAGRRGVSAKSSGS